MAAKNKVAFKIRASSSISPKSRDSKTKQEEFWAGKFGDTYTARNASKNILAGNIALFSNILRKTGQIRSAIEMGANRGLNLQALRILMPGIDVEAVEINKNAVHELRKQQGIKVHHASLFNFKPRRSFELVLIKGVLIHLNPERLPEVYELLYASSSRFICLAEYYNPSPVSVTYRGHNDVLFKRDFAGELLDRYKDLKLVDYGFTYHRDPTFPQDDVTWFLLKKTTR